jgi:hypothetical protein
MKLRVLALAALLALPRAALANDPVAAEALFDRGRALMDKGLYASACPKFAESQRLDPAVGTLLNLAECYDKAQKLALAWATFREADAAASREGQAARAAYAHKRADELEKRLARLSIDVPPDARVDGLVILRDGDAVREPVWGIPVPIDPGPHTIEARAPGYTTYTTTVVATKESPPVVIPLLEKAPMDAPPPATTAAPPPPPPKDDVVVPPPPVARPPDRVAPGHAQRTAGIVVAGVGLAGLAVSGAFAVFAVTKDRAATRAGCDATTCPTTAGLQASNDALTLARVSTWSFVVGAAVVVGGITLWLTAPKTTSGTTAWLAPSLGGAVLGGSF